MPTHDLSPETQLDRPIREAIDAAVDEHGERIIRMRRRIHATPEVSGQERATTALIAETLREGGLEPRVMADDIGVVADIDLGAPGPTFVGLRAELDCVIVNDDKQVPYASTRPGLCHACGHDVHTSIVATAGLVAGALRDRLGRLPLHHNLRLIFQPAEETAVGARSMIKQGALDGVDALLAVHVDPFLEVGTVGVRVGPLTSAAKSFVIRIRGRSGHSARPHEAIDPIPAAINMVSLLYQIAPRAVDSRSPMALTVATISAGHAYNAIPDDAVIGGTLRTTRMEDMETVQRRMESVVRNVGEATGVETELEFPYHCPATDNDARLIGLMSAEATDILGAGGLKEIADASMGAEDFGFYQELIHAAIVRLGVAGPEERTRHPLHSSLFDVHEAALPIGVRLLLRSALRAAMGYSDAPD
jgi:amidohydrolase